MWLLATTLGSVLYYLQIVRNSVVGPGERRGEIGGNAVCCAKWWFGGQLWQPQILQQNSRFGLLMWVQTGWGRSRTTASKRLFHILTY